MIATSTAKEALIWTPLAPDIRQRNVSNLKKIKAQVLDNGLWTRSVVIYDKHSSH